MAKKILNGVVTAVKHIAAAAVTISVVNAGAQGASMLGNDLEYAAKKLDAKINPTVMKSRHWWKRPELYNTRTKKFVADMKKPAKKSK